MIARKEGGIARIVGGYCPLKGVIARRGHVVPYVRMSVVSLVHDKNFVESKVVSGRVAQFLRGQFGPRDAGGLRGWGWQLSILLQHGTP